MIYCKDCGMAYAIRNNEPDWIRRFHCQHCNKIIVAEYSKCKICKHKEKGHLDLCEVDGCGCKEYTQ